MIAGTEMNKQGAAGSSFTRWARLAALLAASGGPCVAIAAALDVKVIDRAGQPAADVVVLVESAAGGRPRAPAETVVILQQNLRFVPALTVVPLGATLRFVNRDDYDHHVRSVKAWRQEMPSAQLSERGHALLVSERAAWTCSPSTSRGDSLVIGPSSASGASSIFSRGSPTSGMRLPPHILGSANPHNWPRTFSGSMSTFTFEQTFKR